MKIQLEPQGKLNGVTTCETINGICQFNNLNVLSIGTYSLIVSSLGVTSAETENFTVESYSFLLTTSSTTPAATTFFDITTKLYVNGLPYNQNYTVSLTETGGDPIIGGNLVYSDVQKGINVYNVSFENYGPKTLIAFVEDFDPTLVVSQTISLQVLSYQLVITNFTAVLLI